MRALAMCLIPVSCNEMPSSRVTHPMAEVFVCIEAMLAARQVVLVATANGMDGVRVGIMWQLSLVAVANILFLDHHRLGLLFLLVLLLVLIPLNSAAERGTL